MDDAVRNYVVNLLTNYRSNKRKAIQLMYEMENLRSVTPMEMLEAMSFSRPYGESRPSGHISDKTSQIALSYQVEATKANDQAQSDLLSTLLPLLKELDRLEYYVRTLGGRQTLVITRLFFEGYPQEDVAVELACSSRTIRSLKQAAVDTLAEMYQLAEHAW